MKEHDKLIKERNQVQEKIKSFEENQADTLAQIISSCQKLCTDINCWTDNIKILQSFAKFEKGVPETEFNDVFGIPSGLEYYDFEQIIKQL